MRSALGALRQNPHISSDASVVHLRSARRLRRVPNFVET